MAVTRKSKGGFGLLLLLLAGCNAARWKSAGLKGGAEMMGYFGLTFILFLFGLWLIVRKTRRRT